MRSFLIVVGLSDADGPDSCELCRIHVCTSNISDSLRSLECSDRVHSQLLRMHVILIIIGDRAVLASFLLNERLGHLGRVGCALCLIGSLIIVLHAPEDKKIETVDEILRFALQPGTHPLH